jgi:3'-5' exoribonuclease
MPRDEIKVDFKVVRSERRTTKNNEPYYALELLDAKGDKYEARLWSDGLEGIKECYLPQEGQYWGKVKSYENVFRGQKQLVINGYWLYKLDEVHEAVKEQFVEKSVIDVDRVIDRMFHWPFWDHGMQTLMKGVEEHLKRDGVWEKIKAIPAGASYHHSVRGGFLLHIDEMLEFSERICNANVFGQSVLDPGGRDPSKDVFHVHGPEHYPGLIDYQILRAGIVLHDIGKVYDYDERTLQFQSNPISDCLEHTIVGVLMVERYWVKDSSEAIDRGLRLMHALAAHHGQEMGAVKPKTPEAIILHHLDMISAHLDVCRQAYNDAKKNGSLPEYSRMVGARPFIPSFFPRDQSVYTRKESDQKAATEEVVTEDEEMKRLPWED